jgi:FkbM family methyltransferase
MPVRMRALRQVVRALPRGGYALLAARVARHGRFISRMAADVGAARFHCDLADRIARETCLTGYYEPPVTRVFLSQLRSGGVVVDAGANWGYFTLVAAAAVGDAGRVIALEPDPRQFAALEANVTLNGFTWVTAKPVAASSAAGRVTLFGYQEDALNRGRSRLGAMSAGGPQFEVEAATIDALTDAHPVVDLVKIDVEGAEDWVLAGMQRGLAAHRYRAIVLELHPRELAARGVDPAAVQALLLRHGYRPAAIDGSPAAYRRAARSRVSAASLLGPLEQAATEWPHLLWLC